MLRDDWYVPNSIDATVRNFISAADLAHVQNASPIDFEKQLTNEFRMLLFFSQDEERRVRRILRALKPQDEKSIFVIDARSDKQAVGFEGVAG